MKPITKAALVVLMLAGLFVGVARCDEDKSKTATPWCCAIPRKWCRTVIACATPGVNYCLAWEYEERCDDLCDHWEPTLPAPSSTVCPNVNSARDPGPPAKPSSAPALPELR
jgi:hypothetical protein